MGNSCCYRVKAQISVIFDALTNRIIIAMKNRILFSLALCLVFLIYPQISKAQYMVGKGYGIYPVPKMILQEDPEKSEGTFSESSAINIIAESGIDEVTIDRARQILKKNGFNVELSSQMSEKGTNLLLGIHSSEEYVSERIEPWIHEFDIFGKGNAYDKYVLMVLQRRMFGTKTQEDLFKPEAKEHQIAIVGENTDAVFCALATLEQMLEQGINGGVVIYDWADVKHRGVIEGYYGVPYSAEVTKDLFRFMARYKLNTYMYGAKSDPYHSRYWSEPYPVSITPEQEKVGYLTQEMMKDITSVARDCKVDFIWAIHPGKAFADPENKHIIQRIMGKFESMYELGVRQFGVFVDDVGVPSDTNVLKLCADNLTALQNAIDKKWNRPGVSPADTVKPLQYVPQLYAYSWVDEERAKAFFETLKPVPEKVDIYITGANVWTVPNNYDIAKVNGWLGKKTSWWWNYLCNDSDVTKLFIADAYTNFRDETHIFSTSSLEENLAGTNSIIVNPMQQGMLSEIGLFSTADYTWNTSAFNNYRSWEAAVRAVGGSALLADLSEDLFNVIPALRYYDNDKFEYLVTRYKQSVEKGKPAPGSLIAELKKVNASCARIEKNLVLSSKLSDALFYRDISPWLLKVEAMTEEAIGLLEGKNPAPVDYDNDPRFRFEILGGMGEHIKMAERTAEPSAKCLLPLIYWLREQQAK